MIKRYESEIYQNLLVVNILKNNVRFSNGIILAGCSIQSETLKHPNVRFQEIWNEHSPFFPWLLEVQLPKAECFTLFIT